MEDRPGDLPAWAKGIAHLYMFIVVIRDSVLFVIAFAYAIGALVVGRTTAAHVTGLVVLAVCLIVAFSAIRRLLAKLR